MYNTYNPAIKDILDILDVLNAEADYEAKLHESWLHESDDTYGWTPEELEELEEKMEALEESLPFN